MQFSELVNNSEANNQRLRRVIRLTPVNTNSNSGNNNKPRSILLPVTSLKNGQSVRTIRIISTGSGTRLPAGLRVVCSKPSSPPVQACTLSSTTERPSPDLQSDTGSEDSDSPSYPRLDLSSKFTFHFACNDTLPRQS
jgi:hypothetical protein